MVSAEPYMAPRRQSGAEIGNIGEKTPFFLGGSIRLNIFCTRSEQRIAIQFVVFLMITVAFFRFYSITINFLFWSSE